MSSGYDTAFLGELKEAVGICTKHVQDGVYQHSIMSQGGVHEIMPPSKDLY